MFEFKNHKYVWNGVAFNSFSEAMYAVGNDACENDLHVEFGDLTCLNLSSKALCQVMLIQAVEESSVHELIKVDDRFLITKFRIPKDYKSNRKIHCLVWSLLEDAYDSCDEYISMENGVFKYEILLSFILDSILFSGNDSPFKKALDVISVLSVDSRTSNLIKHASHADYIKLKALSDKIEACGIRVYSDTYISINDVRECRVPDLVFRDTCINYCEKNDMLFVPIINLLKGMGLVSDEDIYRAVPVYLRRNEVPVNVELLAKYCMDLNICYGDCTLRLEV